jgi:hypothetical protein
MMPARNGLMSQPSCDAACRPFHPLPAAGQDAAGKPPLPASSCNCADDYSPVCGVDGSTYASACYAACNDVQVTRNGRCGGSTAQ